MVPASEASSKARPHRVTGFTLTLSPSLYQSYTLLNVQPPHGPPKTPEPIIGRSSSTQATASCAGCSFRSGLYPLNPRPRSRYSLLEPIAWAPQLPHAFLLFIRQISVIVVRGPILLTLSSAQRYGSVLTDDCAREQRLVHSKLGVMWAQCGGSREFFYSHDE